MSKCCNCGVWIPDLCVNCRKGLEKSLKKEFKKQLDELNKRCEILEKKLKKRGGD